MKKILVCVCVAMLCVTTGAFAAARGGGFGIGGEGSLYVAGSGGLPTYAMLTLHFPRVPVMFAIGFGGGSSVGLTVDYWATGGNLGGVFDWYMGIGGYLALNGGDVALGGRIPIGLQAWPFGQAFELFLEAAPAVGISIVPTGFDWHLQAALGFRFWF